MDDMLEAARTLARFITPKMLWSIADVATYLRCKERQAAYYVALPGFPKAIRLPSTGPRNGHPRYKAEEVMEWAEKYQERI